MTADAVIAAIRELAGERRLPDARLTRWLALDPPSRAAFLNLARQLKLRTGQLVSALELLEEVAVRESVAIASILDRPDIRRVTGGPGSAPSRASAFLEALRATRFPLLQKTQARLHAEIAALKLPRGISVVLPKELGSDELTVSLRASTAAELARLVSAIERSQAGLGRIIDLLGGADSGTED